MLRYATLALLPAVVLAGVAPFIPPAAAPRLLTPTDGAIREVLLAVPREEVPDGRLATEIAQSLVGIAHVLGPDVRYLVHGYPEHEAAITRVLRETGARQVQFLSSAFGYYTRWVRDIFIVLRRGRQTIWGVPQVLPRRLDASVAPEMAQLLDQPMSLLPVAVQGGNVVPFGHVVFAGKDALLDDNGRLIESHRSLVEQTIAPGNRWVWVGLRNSTKPQHVWEGVYQPLFHLDLFFTALGLNVSGQEHVLVASPRLGRRLLGLAAQLEDRDQDYDAIANTLSDRGFRVSRVPLLIDRDPGGPAIISYSNVLLSAEANHRVVYLPRYGRQLTPLDQEAVRVYQEAGYTVRWVDGPWQELAKHFGSLRCLVQVTRRGT